MPETKSLSNSQERLENGKLSIVKYGNIFKKTKMTFIFDTFVKLYKRECQRPRVCQTHRRD